MKNIALFLCVSFLGLTTIGQNIAYSSHTLRSFTKGLRTLPPLSPTKPEVTSYAQGEYRETKEHATLEQALALMISDWGKRIITIGDVYVIETSSQRVAVIRYRHHRWWLKPMCIQRVKRLNKKSKVHVIDQKNFHPTSTTVEVFISCLCVFPITYYTFFITRV